MRLISPCGILGALLTLTACGGGDHPGYAVGGTVAGLAAGSALTLQDGQGSAVTVKSNGAYTFDQPLESGVSYWVAVDADPAGQICTVSNPKGVVAGSNISNVNVSCAAAFPVNILVTGLTDVSGLVLQDNGGDDLAVARSGSYSFKTPVATGQPYHVTILTQPAGHTCQVPSGSGTVAGANVSVVVACPWHVGYAANAQGILAYFIDQSTGTTTAVPGNPVPAGKNPTAMVVTPASGFLYVTNQGDNTVSAYTINPSDGSLAAISGSPYAVGTAPDAIASDSTGKFLFVANSGSNNLSAFAIDATTGNLSAVAGSPFAMEGSPDFLALSDANFLYAGYQTPGSSLLSLGKNALVSGFRMNPGTGALAEITGSPFLLFTPGVSFCGQQQPGCSVNAFAIDPKGRFLYGGGALYGGLTPTGFYALATIDSTSGAVTPVTGSPFVEGYGIFSIVIDRTGSYLYGGNPDADIIYEFAIDPGSGILTNLITVNGGVQNAPGSVAFTAVDPSNTYLFATNSVFSPYLIDHTTGLLGFYLNGATVDVNNAAPVAFSNTP